MEKLSEFIAGVRRLGMLSVLGDSLKEETIPCVATLKRDYIAVRGAVCRQGREGPPEADRVRRLITLL